MNKLNSTGVRPRSAAWIVVLIVLVTALMLGGGRWLWHLLLRLHGMR